MSRNEWLAFRSSCDQKDAPSIGGSSIGCVCGYDDFKHPMIFYLEKVGVKESDFVHNKFTASGNALEAAIIYNMWQFWDGNDWLNFSAQDIKVREAIELDATLWNPEYPWFYMNTDAVIIRDPKLSPYYGWGINEIKTMGGHYSDKYETGFPMKYYFQVQAYMMGTGAQYGNLTILVDGRDLMVYPIEKSEKVQDEIKFKCEAFVEAVIAGRKVWSDGRMKYNTKIHAIMEIMDNYPFLFEIDHDENISRTLSKMHVAKEKKQVKRAPENVIRMAEIYDELKERATILDERRKKIGNELRKQMLQENVRQYAWTKDDERKYVSFNKKFLVKT